jgi:hypothetical protein
MTLGSVFPQPASAVLGFVGLLGWFFNAPLLSSFGANFIPMAPNTSLIFIVLGIAVVSHIRYPQSRVLFLMNFVVASITALSTLLLLS